MKIRTLAALAFLTVSSVTYAQPITDSFTYQGTLNDLGVPANGTYDLGFLVYDDPIAGSVVPGGSAGADNVEIVDGLFQAFVDFGISGVLFNTDQTRWLQIVVKRDADEVYIVIGPRQRMAPTPVANYAINSGTTLQNAYRNNPDITMEVGVGPIDLFSTEAADAGLRMYDEFGNQRVILFKNAFGYGDLSLFGIGNNVVSRLYSTNSANGGGILTLARNGSGANGVSLVGNSFGSESPRMLLTSATQSIDLDTSAVGDESVNLPNDAINSTEMLNETGLAESEESGAVTLTNVGATVDIVNTVTINCPTSGYVFVIASAELSINHVSGALTTVNVGVSQSGFSIPSNGDLETRIDPAIPSGFFESAVTAHGVFSVSQGITNFFLLGDKNNSGGSATLSDRQLTAIFIPTAYGSASLQSTQNGNIIPDELSPITSPMTDYDILREQNAALQANAERQQREIDEMRTQMESIVSSLQEHDSQETGIE